MSVIATLARWAAERRGRVDMMMMDDGEMVVCDEMSGLRAVYCV
jgi:hypothetical protein